MWRHDTKVHLTFVPTMMPLFIYAIRRRGLCHTAVFVPFHRRKTSSLGSTAEVLLVCSRFYFYNKGVVKRLKYLSGINRDSSRLHIFYIPREPLRRRSRQKIRYKTFPCPSKVHKSGPEMRQTSLMPTRSAAVLWNKVSLSYSREFKVLEAMLTAIDLIARCESGCHPPRIDKCKGNSLTAAADSFRTLPNLPIFSSHVFWSRSIAFSIPSRTRAGERGLQNAISNISEPPWLPNALISGCSLWCPNGRDSTTKCLAALIRSASKRWTLASCRLILWIPLSHYRRWSPYISMIASHCMHGHYDPYWNWDTWQ